MSCTFNIDSLSFFLWKGWQKLCNNFFSMTQSSMSGNWLTLAISRCNTSWFYFESLKHDIYAAIIFKWETIQTTRRAWWSVVMFWTLVVWISDAAIMTQNSYEHDDQWCFDYGYGTHQLIQEVVAGATLEGPAGRGPISRIGATTSVRLLMICRWDI